jgi:hypothetical protein
MPINFDVVIDTPEYEVDMKSGLDTMQGISDATQIIGETLLTGEVPERITARRRVRTTLKKSFKGSYGHTFRLDALDDQSAKELRRIGNATFSELVAYFMKEALYIETDDPSDKAQKVLNKLGEAAEKLIKQLRISVMKDVHEVAVKFGHDVHVQYRKTIYERIQLAKFTADTVHAVQAARTDEKLNLNASIRRLNTNTGNGRLQLEDGEETIAFGFRANYRDVDFAMKRKFSDNLHHNNGIDSERWEYLEIVANPIKLLDGRIVKYIVIGFFGD